MRPLRRLMAQLDVSDEPHAQGQAAQAAHAEVAWSVASEAGAPVEGGKGEEGFLCRWQVAGVQVDVSWLWLPWLACLK